LGHLRSDSVGDRDRIAGRLARDVQQHCRTAVGGNKCVDGLRRLHDFGKIADADRGTCRGGLDGELSKAVDVVSLRTHEREDELMVLRIETG
jgi:hypothetical protein